MCIRDRGNRLYAIRIGKEQKVKGVEFLLKPEDPASLHFWQRPVACLLYTSICKVPIFRQYSPCIP